MKFLKIILLLFSSFTFLIALNYWWIEQSGSDKLIHLNSKLISNRKILVLGAGREYRSGKHPNYFFNGRVQAVVALRHAYPNCQIIISGISDGNHYDEANDMKQELLARGIKDTLITLDHKSDDTYASLQMFNREYLYEPVIIVSQKTHLCRTLWMAKQMNIDAVGFEAPGWPKREPYWFLIREIGARTKATIELLF